MLLELRDADKKVERGEKKIKELKKANADCSEKLSTYESLIKNLKDKEQLTTGMWKFHFQKLDKFIKEYEDRGKKITSVKLLRAILKTHYYESMAITANLKGGDLERASKIFLGFIANLR